MAINQFKYLFLGALLFASQAPGQAMPPTVAAAKAADWAALNILLQDNEGVNATYGDGTSALHWASYHDDVMAARGLLTAGADVNATTDLGVTPLWLAAENGSSEMVALLIDSGADANASLVSGESIVVNAARSGNGDVMRQILAAGADPNVSVTREQTPLMWAAGQGHAEVVAALVEYGADIDARSLVRPQYVKSEKEQDSHPAYKFWVELGGHTPLMFAAGAGDFDSAKVLVEAGSDVNALSAFGLNPAIMAVHGGNSQLLELLLSNGAKADAADAGHTALHAAVLRGNVDAVKVLLEHGANPDALLERPTPTRRQTVDYNFHDSLVGATPLWLAARFSEPRIMELLLAAGADPNWVNNVVYPAQRRGELYIAEEGEISVLMAAVGMGHRRLRLSWGTPERRAGRLGLDQEALVLETCRVIVQAGVDVNLRDASGESAVDFAQSRGYESVVGFLLANGAQSK